jgi:O-antigen/teichoic acid export membrane protein
MPMPTIQYPTNKSQSRTFKAAILSSGRLLVTLTGLLCAIVLSRLFTKTDYAAYRQTFLAYAFVAPLLTLGLPGALFYFLPRDKEHGRSILTGNLVLLFLMGCLFALAMWCGGNELLAKRFNNPSLSRLLLIYSPYGLLALPVMAVSACLLSYDRVKALAVYHVASKALFLICVVVLALTWRSTNAAVSGAVIATFLIFFPAIFLMYRAAAGDDWWPTMTNMWEQLKYGVPLGLAAMVGTISKNLDKVIVSSMCPPEQFAVYVNAAMEIPLIGILTGSVSAVLLPEIVKLYKQGDRSEGLQLWKRAAAKCAIIILPVMCFLMVMAPEVIRVVFSAKYTGSVHPFRVYLLLLPIRTVSWGTMLMAAGKSSWILLKTAMTLILNLILSVILVHQIGYIGAVLATVTVIYVWNIPFNMVAISRVYNVPFWKILPYGVFLKIMLISLAAGAVVFVAAPLVRPLGDALVVLILGTLYSSVTLALFAYFNLVNLGEILSWIKRTLAPKQI